MKRFLLFMLTILMFVIPVSAYASDESDANGGSIVNLAGNGQYFEYHPNGLTYTAPIISGTRIAPFKDHTGPNGEQVSHFSKWVTKEGSKHYAFAETTAKTKGGSKIYHYTRTRIVDTGDFERIYRDSERSWGTGYSSAECGYITDSYLWNGYSMRSFFGGVWED